MGQLEKTLRKLQLAAYKDPSLSPDLEPFGHYVSVAVIYPHERRRAVHATQGGGARAELLDHFSDR